MKLARRRCLPLAGAAALGLAFIALTGDGAWSQPARTIKLVVPFPPGGGADTIGRLLADQIARVHKATFVIENRPGAGTRIATEGVARTAPDGNTVLLIGNSFIINPSLRKVAYDPLASFEPICLLTRSPNVIVVNNTSPFRSLTDLLNEARAKPGNLTMAFQGPATSQHIGTEKLKRAAKINMVNVPFLGAAPAVNALMGDHVAALFVNYPSVSEQVRAGSVRVLAAASRTRIELLPDVPTIAEIVQADFDEDVWFGVVVPAKTARQHVSQLADWFRSAVLASEVRPKLVAQGFTAAGTCGADVATFLRDRVDDYSRIVRETNIKAE